NCFEHVEIVKHENPSQKLSSIANESETKELIDDVRGAYETFEKKTRTNKSAQEKLDFSGFIEYEIGVETGETLSDSDIISIV
ncbi:unnamed protein product, partial [Brachionus calyciflorus]